MTLPLSARGIGTVLGHIKAALRRTYYDALIGRLGYSRRIPASSWDDEYRRGQWEILNTIDEMPHHMLTVGYLRCSGRSDGPLPTILDVGCGHGRLLELLRPLGLSSYLGVDISAEAIRKAQSLRVPEAAFAVADFEAWQPPTLFRAIVFSESLFYATRPIATASRYAAFLDDDGYLLVSQWRHGNHGIIWRHLETRFDTVQGATVGNDKGQTWDVRVLRPHDRRPSSRSASP